MSSVGWSSPWRPDATVAWSSLLCGPPTVGGPFLWSPYQYRESRWNGVALLRLHGSRALLHRGSDAQCLKKKVGILQRRQSTESDASYAQAEGRDVSPVDGQWTPRTKTQSRRIRDADRRDYRPPGSPRGPLRRRPSMIILVDGHIHVRSGTAERSLAPALNSKPSQRTRGPE